MADDTLQKKKPIAMSLNQLHSRRLVDLSASRSKPPPPSSSFFIPGEEMERPKFELGRRKNVVDNDVPSFSGIADFDSSPSPDVAKSTKEKQHKINDSIPGFSAIADFESSSDKSNTEMQKMKPEKVKIEGRRRLCKVSTQDDDGFSGTGKNEATGASIPRFSGIDDFESSSDKPKPEKQNTKPEKVKVEGRRRLCKISTQDDDSEDYKDGNNQFRDISDFSSPPRSKGQVADADDDGGANEIRDILNDLSSRLEFLSIEKKKNPRPFEPRPVPLHGDSLNIESSAAVVHKKVETGEPEFTSAGSSFDGSAYFSDSSPGVADTASNSELDSEKWREFDGTEKSSKNVDKGTLRNVNRKEKTNPAVPRRKFVPNIEVEEEEGEDDCVVLGSGQLPKQNRRAIASSQSYGKSSVVEVLDDDGQENVSEDHAITLSGPRSTYKLPAKIGKMLYPHQRDGLRWLWSLHCQGKGGLLGDDMGLGKTMQISGYLAGLFNSRLIKRVMIVAPKTLIPHWMKELSAVGLSQMMKEYFGTNAKLREYELQYVLQDKGILLTTYDIVRNNTKQLCGAGFYEDDYEDGPIWDYMILDEGHLIKNPSTQRAKSLLEIPCAHRIIISGTPIQNNLKELWALFNFCCPELLGDKKWFKDKYEHPILRGNDKNASERDKRVGSMVAKELRERIQPYFLRRLKNEVFRDDGDKENAKLSKKNEIIVWLRLTNCQRHLYEAFLKSEIVLSAFDGSPLAAITILKKICDHPCLLTKRAAEDVLEGLDSELNQDDRDLAAKLAMHAADLTSVDDFREKHDNISCKISFVMSLLEKLIPEGHSVLIFSQTRKMLNLIQDSLVKNGFDFLRIDGTTKAPDRLKIVNEFQEGNSAPIFLLTSQVGGLGLTLTRADRVIVADPAWNPSMDNQSVDRAYRIGQKKDVLVYRLMTCGTIEEKIYRMQVFKGGLFKTATEHKEQTRYFTQQDLKELFSLPKDGFDISPTQQQLHAEHGHQISLSDDLKNHIKFLESLGIGGVSHHSLLFSKSEPAPDVVQVEEDPTRHRKQATTIFRNYGSSSTERPVDGSQYAFNPKEVPIHKNVSSPVDDRKLTESDIKDRINRLSKLLSNTATVSRLPDRGETSEANRRSKSGARNLQTPKRSKEVIDLDDIADELQRSLHV